MSMAAGLLAKLKNNTVAGTYEYFRLVRALSSEAVPCRPDAALPI
jgi:hypothetical protein